MPSAERLARRERARIAARKAGNRRAAEEAARREPSGGPDPKAPSTIDDVTPQPPSPRVTPPGASLYPQEEPVPPRTKAKPVVIPEPLERQVARQVAAVNAAEAKRRANAAPASKPRPKPTARTQAAPEPAPDEHQELGKAIKALRPEFLQCRDYLHAWRPFTAQWMPTFNVYEVREQCLRCHTTRSRELDRHGHVLARHYDYPDGYTMKGLGRLTGEDRDQIRLASLLNIIDKKEERKHA